jgi:hypothetical protein
VTAGDRPTLRIPADPVASALACWRRERVLRERLAAAIEATNAAHRALTVEERRELGARLR